jgi:hypothetical protein
MVEITETQKPIAAWKVKLAAGAVAGMGLVSAVAADFDLNGTIGPLIDGVTALLPSLMALVLGLVPLVIVVAIAKFFPQLFDSILGWLRF